jgi:hypothetical protein
MSLPEIYRSLGCSARIYEYRACFRAHEDPAVTTSQRQLNDSDTERIWDTPVGTQRAVYRRSPDNPGIRHLKWPISDQDDLKIATWRAQRQRWSWDPEAYNRLEGQWGDIGAPTIYMPRVTLLDLLLTTMGVEQGTYALMDWPEVCEAYFAALDDSHDRLIDVLIDSPLEIINYGDNIHAGFVPPRWYAKYVQPSYLRRSERLHRAGKFIHAHWDGDCKPLLPFAQSSGLDGIEAITPVPQGDVTLEETKEALGDTFLIDGIPAVYFDTTFSEQTLIDCTRRILELFAPNLILGISDEISSTGDIERIRLVGRIVDDYNASL